LFRFDIFYCTIFSTLLFTGHSVDTASLEWVSEDVVRAYTTSDSAVSCRPGVAETRFIRSTRLLYARPG